MSSTKPAEGFTPHEITAIAVVISESLVNPEGPSGYQIANEMENAGFNKVATSLSLTSLKHKRFVVENQKEDDRGFPYLVYRLTEKGESWALQNQDKLGLEINKKGYSFYEDIDEDIPF